MPDDSKMKIILTRGVKKIDTGTKPAKSGVVRFNERFVMKTSLEYDPQEDVYTPKMAKLKVVMGTA